MPIKANEYKNGTGKILNKNTVLPITGEPPIPQNTPSDTTVCSGLRS